MGYGYYLLPDGREAGYAVDAECDHPDCNAAIDRGLGHLCGRHPDGHRGDEDPGCGKYFCTYHLGDHDCPNPECDEHALEGNGWCGLSAGHDLPHRDPWSGQEFTEVEP
ncbi:hypothetical protein ACQP1O_42910 (plasmid) [Nocardia sp. CA-151230]|uniref:hypothetical protein n=1 Tax=Nocardia sp. CA-151230 TaxID=3239982 RepID=UPI003D9097AE